jgi:S-formylglutathione hydrolase FrmB
LEGAGFQSSLGGLSSAAALKEAGVNAVFSESPNTENEWQSWRRSLHQFAPLLFKD